MPQKITCSECDYTLYEGDILKSPLDIVKKFDGKCPNCGKPLGFTTDGVVISPCDEGFGLPRR